MNYKTTSFLLLMLGIVGAFYFWAHTQDTTDFNDIDAVPVAQQDGTALFSSGTFTATAIERITIKGEDSQTIVIVRDAADWKQTAPVKIKLSKWSMDDLVDAAGKLRHVEKIKQADKKPLGLEPARAVVMFQFEQDGKTTTQTIKLGDRLALGGRGYVLINDDPAVYVVSDTLHNRILDGKLNDLRNKGLSAASQGEASRVIFAKNGATIDMIKSDGQWAFGGDHSGRVDSEAVKTLLGDIDSIYVSKFIADSPEDLSLYGLDAPQRVVTVQVPAPAPPQTVTADDADKKVEQLPPSSMTMRIGAAENFDNDSFFATWGDTDDPNVVVFTISKYTLEKFDKSLDDFRDARITPLKRADVREFAVQRRDGSAFKLLYDSGEWSFAAPGPAPGFEADNTQSRNLVDDVVSAKAEAYQENTKTPNDLLVTITITVIGGTEPDVLKVFGAGDDKYLVLRNNETTGCLVRTDDLKRVFEPVITLRDRLVLDLTKEKADRLVIQRADGVTFDFIKDAESDQWSLAGHEKFEVDALNNLLNDLLPLKASGWQETVGYIPHTLKVVVTDADGRESAILIYPQTRIARLQDGAKGFTISQSLWDKLDGEYRYRTVLDITTDDIKSVTVHKGNASVSVTKDKEGKYVGSQQQTIDQDAAGSLFDTLAGLRVERFKNQRSKLLPQPQTRIDIETRSGQTRQLDLMGKDFDHVAVLGKQTFTLNEAVRSKLTADLIEQPTK